MNAVLKAKFKVTSITIYEGQREFHLSPVYGTDGTPNAQWSKWTPSGELKMTVTNENAFETLEVGKEYFLDFTPDTAVEQAASA